MIELTDVHSHILPGLDDGSRDMKETIDALKAAEKQGISRIIATPHYFPERYEVKGDAVRKAIEKVQHVCREEGISIKLYPGQECYGYSGLTEKLKSGEVLTLGDSRFVLVEFIDSTPFITIKSNLSQLQDEGYYPVLAHFERYDCLKNDSNIAHLKSMGVLLQMNWDTLKPKGSIFNRNPWRKTFLEGKVDLLGSDCHGEHFRPMDISPAMKWLEEAVPEHELNRVVWDNVEMVLG